ncbi:hypothetical protein P7K49_001610 [Saguinus oedipus]|uniref:Uncharacterized protein n=1 Tax=Saguinus oedipus TaxID=9490 RepID=A0ABQ9WEZ5_SAGOE|nr:hypothetical protein P7K49_001610 [Saguinus oedipus]
MLSRKRNSYSRWTISAVQIYWLLSTSLQSTPPGPATQNRVNTEDRSVSILSASKAL